ncbi:MGH1-like glycoside hydrolase domain-containing protein [Georgenia daeguensis]|uniref:Mannosylglycerate hydrolase MGH1-like glycoside hydrolase domain-containing protein n=1 Tax=Georgenia daeguensis TaxID=908355 RepID=A0ABP8EY07_9MICO
MSHAIDAVEALLDLEATPFTLPGSRLFVLDADAAALLLRRPAGPEGAVKPTASGDAVGAALGDPGGRPSHSPAPDAGVHALAVCTAEYERAPADCVVVERLAVRDGAGRPLAVTRVAPDRIELGHVTLTFAGPHALSLGSESGQAWSAALDLPAPARDGSWEVGLPSAPRAVLSARGVVVTVGEQEVALSSGGGGWVELAVAPVEAGADHAAHLAATRATWAGWMSRTPVVRPDLAPMTALCWWVLGANQVDLHGHHDARAVVPSKIGYVGLWQWDAYFIAAGLRHGAPRLARHQIDLALRHAAAGGQLPDVVHDGGVLASSADLPPGDLEALRRKGSGAADSDAVVPLTKPPLTAWAVRKVHEALGDDEWARTAYRAARRSQDWWFAAADSDGDGMPEYGHPYSSGLDDSPVFDAAPPVISPDLGAYLVQQDDLLARHAESDGDADAAAALRERADRTMNLLLELWDEGRGLFAARAGGRVLDTYAVVSLLPLLTGRLPEAVAARLRAALTDDHLFGAPWGVPTVARCDADFDPDAMWRGPTWLNMCALLVEGLDAVGRPAEADALAERALAGVVRAGGPCEYLNPLTGERAPTATTSFGWTAALFVDLAVRLSRGSRGRQA